MAGRGVAPKLPGERRRYNQPARGDWVDLEPLEAPVLPVLPKGKWSARTRQAWQAWREDPVTALYGPADIQHALDLAHIHQAWVEAPTAALASEIRQRLDVLGLSPKGRQDRRWRVPEPRKVDGREVAEVRHIRAVAGAERRDDAPSG